MSTPRVAASVSSHLVGRPRAVAPGALRSPCVVACLTLWSGTAVADLAVPPPLPEPPVIQKSTASSFNLAKRMELWVEVFGGRRCILTETDPAAQIQGIGRMISNHRDPSEQAALLTYYNQHLVAHGQAHLAGVPGFGTWDDIAAKKNASFDWMKANLPHGPADTADQAKAYVAAYLAYRERAAEDHEYARALAAASPCHRKDQAPTGRPQGVELFSIWLHATEARQVERVLAVERDKLVPPGLGGEVQARRVLDQASSAKLDRLYTYGKLLKDAYGAYGALEQSKPTAERMTWFASLYDGERRAAMERAPTRLVETQAALAALIHELIPDVKPAKAVGGAPAATVKQVLSGKHILASRATSAIRTGDTVTTDERELSATKVLVRTYRVAFTAFDVQWVTAGNAYWLDLPGLPARDVCALHHATVRKYTKGVDVQLHKWLVMQDDVLSPMLCKDKASTGSLGE
jgi:hypothetical protein